MSDLFNMFMSRHELREIDVHYAALATSRDMRDIHTQLIKMQAGLAKATIDSYARPAPSQDHSNPILGEIAGSMESLNAIAYRICSDIEILTDEVRYGLDRISKQLVGQQEIIRQSLDVSRNPNRTVADELRATGHGQLVKGIEETNDDYRRRDWDDALRALQESVANTVGKLNNKAWFDIGYLSQVHMDDLPAAENAFDEAVRLSDNPKDPFLLLSLRHLAQVQYTLGKMDAAYATIARAASISKDYYTLYDRARYSARTHRHRESRQILKHCIEIYPPTFDLMLSESDFASLDLPRLRNEIHADAIALAEAEIRRSQVALIACLAASTTTARPESPPGAVAIPVDLGELDRLRKSIRESDYLEVLTTTEHISQVAHQLFEFANRVIIARMSAEGKVISQRFDDEEAKLRTQASPSRKRADEIRQAMRDAKQVLDRTTAQARARRGDLTTAEHIKWGIGCAYGPGLVAAALLLIGGILSAIASIVWEGLGKLIGVLFALLIIAALILTPIAVIGLWRESASKRKSEVAAKQERAIAEATSQYEKATASLTEDLQRTKAEIAKYESALENLEQRRQAALQPYMVS